MKVEITTMELAELLNTIQGRHRVSQNPLGMSADELVEKVADRVIQKVQEVIAENQAGDEENDDEALACTLADYVVERVEALISETRRAAPILLAPDQAAVEQPLHTEDIDVEPAGRPQEEHPEAELPETVGDLYESERTADPDYQNKLTAPQKEPEAPEDEAPKEVVSMPVWDESAGVYVVRGSGYIGRDLWKKEPYYEFFNSEIRQLLKDGKSPRYIADRLKVRERSVMERIRDAKID